MSEVTMTMLEALNKKKLLEQKVAELSTINPHMKSAAYVSFASAKELEKSTTKKEEIVAVLQSNFMARMHAIKNLAEIKSKINASNAVTTIEIAGTTYTIADAIARHRAIETERKFWMECSMQYNTAVSKVEEMNAKARDSENVSKNIAILTSNLTKLSNEMIDQLKESYIADNTVELIDPNNLKGILDGWKANIDEFEAALHGAMIESNVKTMITCVFED